MPYEQNVQVVETVAETIVVESRRNVGVVQTTMQESVVSDRRNVEVVQRVAEEVEVAVPGPQGPPGPHGATGATGPAGTVAPVINFSYGDAPAVVYVCLSSGALKQTSIVIDTPFNGVGSTIEVSVDAHIAMGSDENDPTQAAEYQAGSAVPVVQGSEVTLTIIPGAGTTAGAGRLFLDF